MYIANDTTHYVTLRNSSQVQVTILDTDVGSSESNSREEYIFPADHGPTLLVEIAWLEIYYSTQNVKLLLETDSETMSFFDGWDAFGFIVDLPYLHSYYNTLAELQGVFFSSVDLSSSTEFTLSRNEDVSGNIAIENYHIRYAEYGLLMTIRYDRSLFFPSDDHMQLIFAYEFLIDSITQSEVTTTQKFRILHPFTLFLLALLVQFVGKNLKRRYVL